MEDVSLKCLERDIMDMLMHVVALQDHGKTNFFDARPALCNHASGDLMVHASHAIMHLGVASYQVAMHQGERELVNLAKSMIMHVIDALWNCRRGAHAPKVAA